MKKYDLLVEIGTEEMPAGWLNDTATQLRDNICSLLKDKEITYSKEEIFYTPRRIAVLIRDVAVIQKDKYIEITGPPKEVALTKDGTWTQSALGFANAHGISTKELKFKPKGKKEVVYCEKLVKGEKTVKVLKSNLPQLIARIEFPKSMKWESSGFRFGRPIRWIVALFGNTIIPFEIAGVKSSRKSHGLRFAPIIYIKSPSSYQETLRKNNVIVSFNERMEIIMNHIREFEKKFKLTPIVDEELLREVANLVEYPLLIVGKFDDKYLNLPEEVIVTALKTHQRYFAVSGEDKKLSPYFLVIANISEGDIDKIREGYERVLRARLEDAEFYYKEDMKVPIEKRIEELKGVIWQQGLGTLWDKSERLIKLASFIINYVPNPVNLEKLNKSAKLYYISLLTNMIKDGKEFTELEGVYGGILAKQQKIDPEIVSAIENRYTLPQMIDSPAKVILGIADRIDYVVGSFITGKLPTGTKDPLGIRRVSDELITITITNNLHIPFKELVQKSLENYKCEKNVGAYAFLKVRLGWYLDKDGVRYDIRNAVLELDTDDFADLYARATALDSLKGKEDFILLVKTAKRVRNILNKTQVLSLNSQVLKEPEEKELYFALIGGREQFDQYMSQRDYVSALNWLLNLAPLINNFFDKVLVMAPEAELRENRLALLQYLYSFFEQVADFSKLAE